MTNPKKPYDTTPRLDPSIRDMYSYVLHDRLVRGSSLTITLTKANNISNVTLASEDDKDNSDASGRCCW